MSNRNFLRLIIVISLLVAVSLSSFSIFFLSPYFTELIIKDIELEAVKIGKHLAEPFRDRTAVSSKLPPSFSESVDMAIEDFGLMKIKVFAPDGEIVYSSAKDDIGKINDNDYFHNIVARGSVYTKVVNKDTKSLEGQLVTSDVVETYVPIMSADSFSGAFEIYFDITENIKELENLIFQSNALLLSIAAGLMVAVLVTSFIARTSFKKQETAEQKIIEQSKDLQERNRELMVLNDISRVLSQSIDLKTLLPSVLDTVINRLPISYLLKKGGIMLVVGEKLKLAAHLGHDETFIKLHETLNIHDCLCGQAVKTGEIIISRNSHSDTRHTICYDNMEPHGHIILPLKSAQKVVGVLYLYLPADTEIEELKIDLLESISTQIGMAIDNARLYAETKEMALHDPLTGLANRRYMDLELRKAVIKADRYNRSLCVAMLDIDLFKKFNDTRGHDAGDKLLTMVAEKIKNNIRESDMAARYGGEEFLVIFSELDMYQAGSAVERIRQDIEKNLDVTISGGIAKYNKDLTSEELIKQADAALYQAKEKGRNRIESSV